MKYLLSQIAHICGGELHGADRSVEDVLTDSRHFGQGAQTLFVAMKGKRHDSHNFIGEMLRGGVNAFLVERLPASKETEASYIVVEDSLVALQRLAAHHRTTLGGKMIAIVGSNGKTIIKEWVAQSYSGKGRLFRSPRSYNSQLGVALSLLMCSPSDEVIIVEAGISLRGEMERLGEMVRPDVVLFTSIGDAHQEGFESTEQKIEEKMKMAQRASTLIYHSAYPELREYISKNREHFNFTLVDAAQERGGNFTQAASKCNSQLAEALLREVGCTHYNLDSFSPVAMRLEVKEGLNDSVIVDDSYNSCINSLSIALTTLNEVAASRPTTLILSPILQSGTEKKELYAQVAKMIAAAKVDRVIGVGGEINRWIECSYFDSTEELLSKISREDYASRALLIKGNRNSRFERLTHWLERRSHTTRLEVNLDAMVSNLNHFRSSLSPDTKLIAMVKASSYGAGDFEIAQTLQSQGVDYLAVAFVDEGVTLRERGITMPIIVLNADDDSFEPMIQMRLEPEIYSLRSLTLFEQALERNGEMHYPIHIKIDSGMHRLGFEEGEIEELCNSLCSMGQRVEVASIFSHLCWADESQGEEYTKAQIALFNSCCEQITERIGYKPLTHIANSAAIINYPQAHASACRLGIGLYGFGTAEEHLTPIATLKSRIVQVKRYAAGTTIGYGCEGLLSKDSLVATIPVGYADGLRRDAGCGKWSMRIGGCAAPIVGRVCMDSVMVDVTDIPQVKAGDEVTIFSEAKGNTAADMANVVGTIPYEILTAVSKRVKRVYLKE